MQSHLIAPHGGKLVQLQTHLERHAEIQSDSRSWPSLDLDDSQLLDLEQLICGGFSPLEGFQTRAEYESVCSRMRLQNGLLWPIPVTLAVAEELAKKLEVGEMLALRDPEGFLLAALHVEDVWQPDVHAEAITLFGTDDPARPGVEELLRQRGKWYLGGKVESLRPVPHYDFRWLRHTPDEMRAEFIRSGWRKVLAFPARATMHRAHREQTLRAAKAVGANLLIHPLVEMGKPGEIAHYTRVRCFEALMRHYPPNSARLSLLPLRSHDTGTRDALRQAIIHRNYGCSHILVEDGSRDPDGAALALLREHEEELGVQAVLAEALAYVEEQDDYLPKDSIPEGCRPLTISPEELVRRLADDREIPGWFTFPEVANEMRAASPPRHSQGFTVFFTGLSGAGKSTIANVLTIKLLEMGGRPVTLLDGDIVRKNLSSQLGFTKEDRDINIRRIGFVASEITKNGGIAICAPIAPYHDVRAEVRRTIEPCGGFILVHVSTPLAVCEDRDPKGLYAKAREGIIQSFTGVSDPYEFPEDAELAIDTSDITPEEAAQEVLLYLEREGYIGDSGLS